MYRFGFEVKLVLQRHANYYVANLIVPLIIVSFCGIECVLESLNSSIYVLFICTLCKVLQFVIVLSRFTLKLLFSFLFLSSCRYIHSDPAVALRHEAEPGGHSAARLPLRADYHRVHHAAHWRKSVGRELYVHLAAAFSIQFGLVLAGRRTRCCRALRWGPARWETPAAIRFDGWALTSSIGFVIRTISSV